DDLHPVENVSWTQCDAFVRRVGLRLPTEDQWEYACRAGTQTTYWCGDEPESLEGNENVADRSFASASGVAFLPVARWKDGWANHAPVGSFAPNPFGIYDTLGNVAEWCQDRFNSTRAPDDHEPG